MRGPLGRSTEPGTTDPTVLAERVESLASWMHDLDGELRTVITLARDPKLGKELARALESWSKEAPKLEDKLAARIGLLSERIATVADTANATAGTLAGKQGELAALRREVEQLVARMDAALHELRASGSSAQLAQLREAVAALAAERQPKVGRPQTELMPAKGDVLAERIDMLAKTVAITAAGLAGREGELATLRRSIEETKSGLDAVAAGLRSSLDSLSAHVAGLDERTLDLARSPGLAARVERLAASLQGVTHRVDAIAGGVDAATATLGNRERELAAMHRHFEEASARIHSGLEQLETLLSALPEPGALDPALAARLGSLDRQVGTITEHLAELEAVMRDTASVEPTLEAVEVGLAQLGDRLAAIERDQCAVGAQPARVSERLAARRSAQDEERDEARERRLAYVESRLEALAALVSAPAETSDATVRTFAALAARLDMLEAADHRSDEGQVDDLARRLDALERHAAALAPPGGVSLAGEGRFLVELRALELRVEHGELAARESRDAILTQLERLGTRIEWRLQQLESAQAAVDHLPPEDAPLGQLVSLRGEGLAESGGG